MIVEIITSAVAGGAATQVFRWLSARRGAELTEQQQYRKTMGDIVERYQQQLDEQAERHKIELEAAAARLREQIARAEAAELESERERSRRHEAERERDAERARANSEAARGAELKTKLDRALVSIDMLTADISTLKKSTSGEHYAAKSEDDSR